MAEEELCPEAKEYLEWYDREAASRIRKFAIHLVNCPKCQREILSVKDSMALQMLTMSDEEAVGRFRAVLEQEEGNV
ncbi:hypothetical protein LCGC14_1316850 [marine sediment metagenome]|uniref:Zinc-finger domain-containing protein n=1 Tax=marine sediment metagenome TaxID=412755 RepID=A0A0F9KL68_9ZZZZ